MVDPTLDPHLVGGEPVLGGEVDVVEDEGVGAELAVEPIRLPLLAALNAFGADDETRGTGSSAKSGRRTPPPPLPLLAPLPLTCLTPPPLLATGTR
nr:unnamed protein product [Digitaria exilis]